MAADLQPWGELSWDPDWAGLKWFELRVLQVARWVQAFENALKSAEALSGFRQVKLEDERADWKRHTNHIWLYMGLLRAKQLGLTDLGVHSAELGKVYRSLAASRKAVLVKLGRALAQQVEKMEASVFVDLEEIRSRVPEVVNEGPRFGRLGQELPVMPTVVMDTDAKPLSSAEVRLRLDAESIMLPSAPTLEGLLGALPRGWLLAVHKHLGIQKKKWPAKNDPLNEILAVLTDDAHLAAVVNALSADARHLLAELATSEAPPLYAKVTARYGSDAADGYYWLNRSACGPLSELRRHGLAFVGGDVSGQVVRVALDRAHVLAELAGSVTL